MPLLSPADIVGFALCALPFVGALAYLVLRQPGKAERLSQPMDWRNRWN